MHAIETHGLTKRYGHRRGIEGIDLAVEEGEIFGFIGPNGAGKSTTIRTLLALVKKTSGTASILGMDCEQERTSIAREVGYLPSEVSYYDRMRARDLFKYAASFYDDPASCLARADELARRLGLDQTMRIDDMSLGNKKKVGIVQGLMHAPRLIILDEPTSGLDPLAQQTFFDLIREENRRGATVLFSSHILSEVQRICDRVAILREGRVVEVRSIAEMRASAVKRVEIDLADGSETLDGDRLDLRGARSLSVDGTCASFLYEGDVNDLIERLGTLDLANVDISEPDLEDVFMHYYTDEPANGLMPSDAHQSNDGGRTA